VAGGEQPAAQGGVRGPESQSGADGAEAGNLPLASSELQKLIDQYKGTDAATEAVITLNQVRMVNGQSELAVVGLRDFLAASPKLQYRAPAYGLLGAALENSNRYPEAAEAYTNASKGRGTWSISRRAI
jgi:outer membrane protein assembly factor BamD (BamD/ComL family)